MKEFDKIVNKIFGVISKVGKEFSKSIKENMFDPEVDGHNYNEYVDKDLKCSLYYFNYKGRTYKLESDSPCNPAVTLFSSHIELCKSIIDRTDKNEKIYGLIWIPVGGEFKECYMNITPKYILYKMNTSFDLHNTKIEFSHNDKKYSLDYSGDIYEELRRGKLGNISNTDINYMIALYPSLEDGIYRVPSNDNLLKLNIKDEKEG